MRYRTLADLKSAYNRGEITQYDGRVVIDTDTVFLRRIYALIVVEHGSRRGPDGHA